MLGTNQKHVDFMDKVEAVIEPIIKKHIQSQEFSLAEIVYYSSRTIEEVALREIRAVRRNSK